MAYNFKSIADVEVVAEPTESANVLIEENGIVKKAPKTAVGGAGGSVEPDMVITVNSSSNVQISADKLTIETGSVDAVFSAIRAGNTPNVYIKFYSPSSDYYHGWYAELKASIYWYGEYLYCGYIVNTPTGSNGVKAGYVMLNSDGSFNRSELNTISLS